MHRDTIPEFAIVGHPNEGKSSVLSTLAEDDSVRISATPGETLVCQQFPVIIDGREVIRFIDTPGFQNPRKVLHQLQSLRDTMADIIEAFREKNISNPEFKSINGPTGENQSIMQERPLGITRKLEGWLTGRRVIGATVFHYYLTTKVAKFTISSSKQYLVTRILETNETFCY